MRLRKASLPLRPLLLPAVIFFCTLVPGGQQPPDANYDEAKVGTYTLPDPLVFNNGRPVRTAADWTRRRRAEIVELFATNVFGHSPPPPKHLDYEVFDSDQNALSGKAVRKQVRIYFTRNHVGPKATLLLYIPKTAHGPVPVYLSLNFGGNQLSEKDPGIELGTIWDQRTHERKLAPESTRGRLSVETNNVLDHGYAFATISYSDLEPDFKGGYEQGIRPLFLKSGQASPAPDDWGAIGAWSYGLSRALDYLEKDRAINARQVVLIGHSRLGKTVLWAGALDQRFAIVIASCSGEGGASLARRNFGERIRNLVGAFPYWFAGNFQKYEDRENDLPVDMHELIALIAPRPVYITAGETDLWSDPKGEFLAAVAAGPVFALLGVTDLGQAQMPPLDKPVMKTIAFHIHSGGHAITPFDWEQFFKFTDLHFRK